MMRVGTGFDAHRFDESRELVLAGLHWPNEPGLDSHSDGDAVLHAIVDALLSAAGLGDIGSNFGTDDEKFLGASSTVFLSETLKLLATQKFAVSNVAVNLIGERPRFSSRRDEAEQHLSNLVGAPVSVSATTTDGMGFTGRGEGIAVYATALITAAA